MPPKRKAASSEVPQPAQKQKTASYMDGTSFTTAQKNAIAQFTSVTGVDRTLAAKFLRQSGWNIQTATNNYYGAPQPSSTQPALEKQFEQYRADGENKETMDVTATQKYFTDVGVSFEDVDVFIASHIVQSPSFGEITKDGFVKGWAELQCETIPKQKALIAKWKNSLADVSSPQILDKVYKYAFVLMMQNQGQRSADKAMCIEFWKVLLSAPSLDWSTPSLNWLEDWIQFVTNHNSLKTVSRDQWNHVLKFARLSLRDPTLGFHNEEQSWPSVIDEYVEHIKKLRVAGKGDVEMEL